ncbi:hypothetical protein PHLGIDRAFT_76254 [Phlebiopsis gigantea 11061_1 CR5-6]|uniref:Prenyltransferase alpha-alpha toroid domain-containing protein n=1 Tax=Phlebiopsis gigantea (strain 11061_1 CR5-6) TaxID=745531 RepID=A0A0C3S365_PHLG1|nr:hypothetical protein PHLGIDRAFT_76254 [Phlebiopsis gigantea 11061_1 CR5-6]
MSDSGQITLPPLTKASHASHCNRCLQGLPAGQIEVDASRVAIGFYSLGSLDLLGLLQSKTIDAEREAWRVWLWQQQASGSYGTGFKGSSYMTGHDRDPVVDYSEYDTPNLIMSYTSLLSLAILRDDLANLDRIGLIQFIKSCQRDDGSFSALPNGGESDLRCVYCAFTISSMLDDWSGIDLERSIAYIRRCESYEGGYGQAPYGEALGGTTYCALASLHLAPDSPTRLATWITPAHRARTIRWLMQNQGEDGGFSGRTNKISDACYCFWCGASLAILGLGEDVDSEALAGFISQCQFKFGGIAKAPEARPDPYHTYMSVAAMSVLPPSIPTDDWTLPPLDVLWNATKETVAWLRAHVTEAGIAAAHAS